MTVPSAGRQVRAWRDRANRLLLRSGVFEQRWLRAGVVVVLRGLRAVVGDTRARGLWHRCVAALVWSGWPFSPGWVSLHASRFCVSIEHAVWGTPAIARRPRAARANRPLRVGMMAHFHLTLGAQRPLFEAVPDEIELHLFDRSPGSDHAAYLAPLVAGYHVFRDDDAVRMAAAINAAGLDLLLSMVPKQIAYRVFERVDTPCVANVNTGSDLMHHPRVDFHLYTQPEFGYEVRDNEVFCTFTGKPFGGATAYDSGLVCDSRGLREGIRRSWHEREPLMVWHGSLYKLGTGRFFDVILDLLVEDRALRFEFFGKGGAAVLAAIAQRASARGVADRVIYRGVAGFARDAGGHLQPDTFADLAEALRRARFWPDSFPVGGASARFEAFCAGVPSIHMAPATDAPGGPYEDGSLLELPWLLADGALARSREEYLDLARQCLSSPEFAARLVAAQDVVVARVSDVRGWWQSVAGRYLQWEQQVKA